MAGERRKKSGNPDPAQEEPHPLLMALHGNMRSIANSLAEWHSVIDQGWLLAMPQSSQIDEPDSYVWNKRELALQEVTLQAHVKTHGLPAIKGSIIMGAKDQACYEVAQKVRDLFASGNRPCEIELHQNLGHNTPTTFPTSLAHALNFLTR